MSGGVTEVFDYNRVKKVMNDDAENSKLEARAALQRGTEAVKAAISRDRGTALSGAAGANIVAKWDSLSAAFEDFVKEINTRIENANLVGKKDQEFESTLSSYVGSSNQ